MDSRIERNKQYLRDLYAGPFPGHALIFIPKGQKDIKNPGDFTLSDRPVKEWVPFLSRRYEWDMKNSAEMDDDGVPYVNLCTNTGIFATAFGCPMHVYEGMGTPASARPIVKNVNDLEKLPEPTIHTKPLDRILELAHELRKELGDDVPISVPDIQSSFGIAAIIWEKSDFLTSLMLYPDAVNELVSKCHRLLKDFLINFRNEIPNCSMAHCPTTWGAPELGIWLSEDEIGVINPEMFESFCLPWLIDLSETFGGMFMHCCADADHQYEKFKKIPNLRGLNRKFIRGPKACIEQFSDTSVIMMGHTPEEELNELLDLALPTTRFLFTLNEMDIEEAKPMYDRLRKRMPRLHNH